MFFSTYVLTKRGPLAKVWLAAHWDRRLTRNEVKVVDLSQTIMHIVRPVVPIALRTSGELLVGVVRIYALKIKQLLKEATEATLFLRVVTMTVKGATTTGGVAGRTTGAAEKATTMDGVLVSNKGDVEAVTFSWNNNLALKHGQFSEAAAALSETRFDAIADLLGVQKVEGLHKEDGLLASAWYVVEPSSQTADELRNSQQDYDEMAKMRADLMAFNERASGSSTSKSKSSLSSIEKGRGSAVAHTDGNGGIPYPPVTDELDIGVPFPDEMMPNFQHVFMSQPLGDVPEDPFALPSIGEHDEAPAAAQHHGTRKTRPVNVLDLATTTLGREVFEKCTADRADILNSKPRRGPFDPKEQQDRIIVAHTEDFAVPAVRLNADWVPIASVAMVSDQANPTLRVVYGTILHQQASAVIREATRALPESQRRSDEPMVDGVAAAENEGVPIVSEGNAVLFSRKRGRDDESYENAGDEDPGSLSSSAVQTLHRIRAEVFSQQQLDKKRHRRQITTAESLVDGSCSLKRVCHGLCRRDAARTFVDMLVLASKQLVGAEQDSTLGDVAIYLRDASSMVSMT